MKFRDKDGKEISAVNAATVAFCLGNGYEMIEDKEDKPMEKPLKDWTLGELQDFCKGREVCARSEERERCRFALNTGDLFLSCRFESLPENWKLEEDKP